MVRDAAVMLRRAYDGFIQDDCLSLSAALAYYSAFSLAPLLLIAVAIAGGVFGEEFTESQSRSAIKTSPTPH